MAATFTIGDLAERTGCKVPTIRYYEQIGLLPAPARTAGTSGATPRDIWSASPSCGTHGRSGSISMRYGS